jgi:hypothetical protein
MELRGKRILVCNCEGTMPLDGRALAEACGADGLGLNRHLCRAELGDFRKALGEGGPLLVACTQEAPLFEETRTEAEPALAASYANIRERAGWSAEAAQATPKIAALLAEAAIEVPGTPSVTMKSCSTLLIYGRDERALDAARQLKGRLAGSHWMFQDAARVARIKMCEDCWVIDELESVPNPMATRPRPKPRTTDDYLREREVQEKRARLRAECEAQQKPAGEKPKDQG